MAYETKTRIIFRWRLILAMLAAAGALLLAVGCFARRPVVYQEMAAPQIASPPRSIAILPFANQTDIPELSRIVRVSMYDHLSHRRFKDVELDDIDRILSGEAKISTRALTPALLRDLGARLGCDAIVTGEVTEFERLYMGIYSQLSIGARIAIHTTHDGRRLWTDSHVARLHDGGMPLTPLGIPLTGARSGWNLRDSQIVRAVDELTRTLADRIPGPHAPAPVAAAYLFELQVGAFLDHQLALEQRNDLQAMGFPVAVHSEMHQGATWHRVMVGPCADEQEALRIQRQLRDRLGIRPFLRRRPL